ncbi:MAG: OOP family OmpA-OmpF porin [Arenicella sp.]|jgi:OOP family OmpA-OmpF porin
MKYFLLTACFFCLFSANIDAQKYSSSNKKAIKLFEDARKSSLDRDFDKAITTLEKALKTDPNFAEAHQEMGMYYMVLRDIPKARGYFNKALELQPDAKNMMMSNIEIATFSLIEGDYEQANKLAKKYLSYNPPARFIRYTNKAKGIISTSDYAIEGMKNPVDFKPTPLSDSVNKFSHQFFPVLTADQKTMIFTALDETLGDENMFECTRQEDGTWSSPKGILELNTKFNEGTCSISADGKTILFTSCEGAGNKRQIYGSCDLFISKKVGGVWSPPRNIGNAINTKYWESQPALSADGNIIFFASDRPGGKGGRDLWITKADEKGKWSRPINLEAVNSRGNEFSPFIHASGQNLFFSSDGFGGFGRLDLFKSDKDKLNNWSKPENLGYPINNSGDQAALFITADGLKGYYSDGIMKDGRRVKDIINVFDIPKEIQIQTVSDVVKGIVYDNKTKEKIGAKIDLLDLATEKVISSVTSDIKDGDYLITLAQGSEYALYVNKPGYLFKSLSFNYKEKKDAQSIEVDVYLDPIEKDSKVTLNNIFFASGSYDLEDKSQTELHKLIRFMQENSETKIEIGAHTDNVGTDASNNNLSQKRAQSVVDFLKESGIPKANIIAHGYGETQPIVSNDTDEGKAKNRRIEFKIL